MEEKENKQKLGQAVCTSQWLLSKGWGRKETQLYDLSWHGDQTQSEQAVACREGIFRE